jgi:hypothetical protein
MIDLVVSLISRGQNDVNFRDGSFRMGEAWKWCRRLLTWKKEQVEE